MMTPDVGQLYAAEYYRIGRVRSTRHEPRRRRARSVSAGEARSDVSQQSLASKRLHSRMTPSLGRLSFEGHDLVHARLDVVAVVWHGRCAGPVRKGLWPLDGHDSPSTRPARPR